MIAFTQVKSVGGVWGVNFSVGCLTEVLPFGPELVLGTAFQQL